MKNVNINFGSLKLADSKKRLRPTNMNASDNTPGSDQQIEMQGSQEEG